MQPPKFFWCKREVCIVLGLFWLWRHLSKVTIKEVIYPTFPNLSSQFVPSVIRVKALIDQRGTNPAPNLYLCIINCSTESSKVLLGVILLRVDKPSELHIAVVYNIKEQ